jgi:hypothetical protein
MLSDRTKGMLAWAVRTTVELTSLERVQRVGPEQLLDGAINGRSKDHPMTLEIAANREEAIKYVAGLLGMY